MGAVVQMNGEYVNGLFTRKHALSLIKSGVVSLLGSDCHNMDNRKPNLDKTFKIVKSKCGQETLDKIDRCGREILGI
jgi:protein-tyrosine phosphatase